MCSLHDMHKMNVHSFILVVLIMPKTLVVGTHEVSLHDQKVGLWCALSGRRIIGPIFFYDKVNSVCYVNSILEPFFQVLN
jgi:hypothetical protein